MGRAVAVEAAEVVEEEMPRPPVRTTRKRIRTRRTPPLVAAMARTEGQVVTAARVPRVLGIKDTQGTQDKGEMPPLFAGWVLPLLLPEETEATGRRPPTHLIPEARAETAGTVGKVEAPQPKAGMGALSALPVEMVAPPALAVRLLRAEGLAARAASAAQVEPRVQLAD